MDPLDGHLATMLGPAATFRDGQREAIEAVARDGRRALVVQRTGWGKSLVYWIATRVRRDEGRGPTLIISPLLSLMRNQIAMAERLGLRAATINSGNTDEWEAVGHGLAANAIDVLLISPERLANERFATDVLPSIEHSIGLLVVDEAHCISDWGHDFRPDYRRIEAILRSLDPSVPVLATTATANDRVVADVVAQLGDGVQVFRGPLSRDSLRLDAIPLANQAERLAWLAGRLPELPGSGIVYCLTVADTQRVATFLRGQGIDARPYNADLTTEERETLEDALIAGEMKALVATVALGMGFDKPDLGFVVHYQRPGSAIAYYQQVGRAGRAVDMAYGVLLGGREDDDIAAFFMDNAFPPTVNMHEILDALETTGSMSKTQLQEAVNLRIGRIEQALKLLEIDGAVERDGSRYRRTATPWEQDEARIERVKAARRVELAQMQAYMTHEGCLMEYLVDLLDDPTAAPCGQCARCRGRGMSRETDPDHVAAAISFLRRDLRPIAPRKQWPAGAVDGLSGKIAPPNEPGLALSVLGDAGWGREVQRGRSVDGAFSSELVAAAAQGDPGALAPEPSTDLGHVRAVRLASRFRRRVRSRACAKARPADRRRADRPARLGAPGVDAELRPAAPERAREASRRRLGGPGRSGPARGRRGRLGLDADRRRRRCSARAGSGPVFPFALATASGRD